MALATTYGMKCSGHPPFPPRPSMQAASGFSIGGKGVVLEGHAFATHTAPGQPPHEGRLTDGASGFLIGGMKLGRVGDPLGPPPCGGQVAEGAAGFDVG